MSAREPKLLIALGGATLAQTVAALLWAGAAAERLEQLEARLDGRGELTVRTARLEERTEHVQATLIRIERKIDAAHAHGGAR